MTLIEIAKQAKEKQLFKHGTDNAKYYFDRNGELFTVAGVFEDYEGSYVLTRENLLQINGILLRER